MIANADARTFINSTDSIVKTNQPGYFRELGNNFLIQAASPFHIRKKEWYYVGGGALITAALIHYDYQIDEMFKPVKENNPTFSNITERVTELGGDYGYAITALFIGGSFAFNNKKAIETSRLLTQALITSAVWTRIGKLATGRARPRNYYSDHDAKWSGPIKEWTQEGREMAPSHFDAFPSGHTSTAFAIATVFATQYSDHRAVPIISYSLASIVGVTRMIEHQHWASDIFAGGLLGYLCAKQVCKHTATYRNNGMATYKKKKLNPYYFVCYNERFLSMNFSISF